MSHRRRIGQLGAFLSLILTGALAHAQAVRCEHVFADFGQWKGLSIEAIYETGAAKKKDLARFDSIVTSVNDFLGALARPPVPMLLISKNELSPRAEPLANRIFVGTRLGFQEPGKEGPGARTWFRSPEYAKAVLAHEYGHLVFEANFSPGEPRIKAAYAAIDAAAKEIDALQIRMMEEKATLDRLREESKTLTDPAAMTEMGSRQKAVVERIEAMAEQFMRQVTEIQKIKTAVLDHVTAYNEFFADVVGVLYAERADAVSRALYSAHVAQIDKYHGLVKARSDLRKFGKVNGPVAARTQLEDHNYLSPVREFLWESYLASPTLLKTKKAVILQTVFEAIRSELNFRLDHPDQAGPAHWALFNARLIAEIGRGLEKQGIKSLK